MRLQCPIQKTLIQSPSLQYYGVTRGWLPQRAGSPSLNGGGAAAAVPPFTPSLEVVDANSGGTDPELL